MDRPSLSRRRCRCKGKGKVDGCDDDVDIVSPSTRGRRHQRVNMTALLFFVILPVITTATESNRYFCGSSWDHASSQCTERQHCASGNDDECSIEGYFCFADTLCDASLGHGSTFVSDDIIKLASVAYEDTSNRLFCGSWWAAAFETCSLSTHCLDNTDCPSSEQCCETMCNVQDMIAESLGADWRETVLEGGKIGEDAPIRMSLTDPRRHNSCGNSWANADNRCSKWCAGEGDCPGDLICYADTSCYYDDDLVPTISPVTSKPTRRPTKPYDDPANSRKSKSWTAVEPSGSSIDQYDIDSPLLTSKSSSYSQTTGFCARLWSDAATSCSIETFCTDSEDCEDGFTCHGSIPGCNILDMLDEAKGITNESINANDELGSQYDMTTMNRDDESNNKFCGSSWQDAVDGCSLDRHCPNDICPKGESCFSYLDEYAEIFHCNAFDMVAEGATITVITDTPSTMRPVANKASSQPTKGSTDSPTRHPVLSQSPTNALSDSTNRPMLRPTIQPMPSSPTMSPEKTVFGLCASDLLELQQTYRIATLCSVNQPCPEDGQLCFENVDFQSVADDQNQPTSQPSLSATSASPTMSPATPLPTLHPSSDPTIATTVNVSSSQIDEVLDDVIFCPEGFVGFNSIGDCVVYYDCNDGYPVSIHRCDSGMKFDKVTSQCQSEELVSEYCYGPALAIVQPQEENDDANRDDATSIESTTTNNISSASSPSTPPSSYGMDSMTETQNYEREYDEEVYSWPASSSSSESEDDESIPHWVQVTRLGSNRNGGNRVGGSSYKMLLLLLNAVPMMAL